MRERVIDAAVTLTTDVGWAQVTMARLAEVVGVSRQTVYNEVGSKPLLAEAMILRELERFLGLVTVAFDAHPTDLVAAIRDASCAVLEASQDNLLLKAIVSATHGADTELLPLLTTHAGALLSTAKAVLVDRVAPYDVELSRRAARRRHRHGGPRRAQPRHAALRRTRRGRRRTSPGSPRGCSGRPPPVTTDPAQLRWIWSRFHA